MDSEEQDMHRGSRAVFLGDGLHDSENSLQIFTHKFKRVKVLRKAGHECMVEMVTSWVRLQGRSF